jgi:hypothetical protein
MGVLDCALHLRNIYSRLSSTGLHEHPSNRSSLNTRVGTRRARTYDRVSMPLIGDSTIQYSVSIMTIVLDW